jgi:hypothetical protein
MKGWSAGYLGMVLRNEAKKGIVVETMTLTYTLLPKRMHFLFFLPLVNLPSKWKKVSLSLLHIPHQITSQVFFLTQVLRSFLINRHNTVYNYIQQKDMQCPQTPFPWRWWRLLGFNMHD